MCCFIIQIDGPNFVFKSDPSSKISSKQNIIHVEKSGKIPHEPGEAMQLVLVYPGSPR